MFTLPPALRIYLATTPTDLRKGFDGLSGAVMQVIGEDPASGHLFVFRNRRGDQVRILFWDRTGYCIFAKRLAQGRFQFVILLAQLRAAQYGAHMSSPSTNESHVDLVAVRAKHYATPRIKKTRGDDVSRTANSRLTTERPNVDCVG